MRLTVLLVANLLYFAHGFCPAADGDGLSDVLTANVDPSELEGAEVITETYDSDGNPEFIRDAEEGPEAFEGNKILQEFGNAVTSPKMDKIYSLEEKKTSALLMLEYVLRETSFDPEYLTNTFMKKALVNTKEALAEKKFTEKESLEFLSTILHHLQSDPPVIKSDKSADTAEQGQEEEDKIKDEL